MHGRFDPANGNGHNTPVPWTVYKLALDIIRPPPKKGASGSLGSLNGAGALHQNPEIQKASPFALPVPCLAGYARKRNPLKTLVGNLWG